LRPAAGQHHHQVEHVSGNGVLSITFRPALNPSLANCDIKMLITYNRTCSTPRGDSQLYTSIHSGYIRYCGAPLTPLWPFGAT